MGRALAEIRRNPYLVAPALMNLNFPCTRLLMVQRTTLTVPMVVAAGHSVRYSGLQLPAVYAVFATTLYRTPG